MEDLESPIATAIEQIRTNFKAMLDKTNKENPRPQDVKALADLLDANKSLELWRDIARAGYMAELTVLLWGADVFLKTQSSAQSGGGPSRRRVLSPQIRIQQRLLSRRMGKFLYMAEPFIEGSSRAMECLLLAGV